MIGKQDRKHYFRLGVSYTVIGAVFLLCGFVGGVSAEWHGSLVHILLPWYLLFPAIGMAGCMFGAHYLGKRWPLGIWIPFFLAHIVVLFWQLACMWYNGMELYIKYPCYTQTNRLTGEDRCICVNDGNNYMTIGGKTTIDPCVRVLTFINVLSQISYCTMVLSLIPIFLSFILVCNDLCCVSCRRANSMPQVLVTQGGVTQTVVLQSDGPGPSVAVVVPQQDAAGPLPSKQQPYAY